MRFLWHMKWIFAYAPALNAKMKTCVNAAADYVSGSVLQCNSLDFHFLYLWLLRFV